MEAILLTIPDGPILDVNPAAEELFGYSKEEFQRLGRAAIVDMEDPKLSVLLEERRLKGEAKGELTFIRKNGKKFRGLISSHIFYDENGNERSTMIIRDISKIKKAEKAVKESESYYRAIFEHTGTATVIIDEDTMISLANEEFEKLSGYSREELECHKSWTDFVEKEDLGKMREYHRLRRINSTSAPLFYDFRFIDRAGNVKNIHLDIGMIPGTKRSVASLLDVTDRKKALEEVQKLYEMELEARADADESKNQISIVLERISDSFVALDNKWYYTYVNKKAAELFEKTPEEMVGQHIWTMFPEGIGQPFYKAYHKALKEQVQIHLEEYYPPYDRWFENDIYPSEDGITIFFKEITERVKMQEEILSKERELSSIYNNISEVLYSLSVEEGDTYKFISVNQAFLDATGLTEAQVVGKYVHETIPEPSLSLVLDNYKKAISEKKTVRWEEVTEYPTGRKYGDVSITPVFDAEGLCTKLIGTVHDITERKEMQKEILFKTTLLEAQLESTIDGILVVDDNGRPILYNQCFGEMWRIPPAILKSDDDKNIIDCVLTQLKYPEIFTRKVEYLYANKSEKSLDEIEFKDGKIFERYSSPLIDAEGKYNGRIWYFRDITELKQSQKALIESEKNYRELVDNSLVGVYKTNLKGDILFANTAMANLGNLDSFEDLNGRNIIEFYNDPADREKLIKLLKKEGKVNQYEMEMISDFGEIVNVLITAQLSNDTILGMIIDTTEKKKAETALITSENKYRAIFDNAEDGIFLMNGAHFIECNEKVLEIYGVTRDQIIGENPILFSPEFQRDGERSEDKAKRFIKQALEGYPQHFEWEHLRHDGTSFCAEVSLNRVKIEDEYLIQSIVRDVTPRKETEHLLKESEYRHKMVGQLISDFAYSCVQNSEGIYEIEWITDSFYHMTGFSENELKLKQCWLFIVHPEDNKLAHKQLKELKAGLKNVRIFRIININGEVRWIRNHVQCVEDNDSGNLRIYGAAQDITQLKQREETIENSLREKEVLLQEIHHRVKNNMQVISSLLSLQADFVDEDMRCVLEGSQNRVKSMALVHEKLYQSQSLSRIEMVDYIQSLVSYLFYSHITKKDQINLIFEIEDIEFNIETAIPCGLILNELISNSLKYAFPSGRTGEMYISLKLKEDNYELIIKDNGIGLPENLDFENTDSLGLQLVNSLITQLDGEIDVDRSCGTEFKITFRELKYSKRI